MFSGGKMPYGGLSPLSLSKLLKDGERMEAPDNAACSQEMYVISQRICHVNVKVKMHLFTATRL